MRNSGAGKAVGRFIESEIKGSCPLHKLAPKLQVLFARVPNVIRRRDVQHVGACSVIVRVLVPVTGKASADSNAAADRPGMGEDKAIVVRAGLRKSQQENTRPDRAVFFGRQVDQGANIVIV